MDQISYATHKSGLIKFKIVFVGDQAVGKSSIISRYIKNQFQTSHNATIGIDFISKNLTIQGNTVRLQLWDTAGQQRFRSLIPGYLKDCNAAFVVFDITTMNPSTFESIEKWMDFVKQSRGNDVLIYLIGNKHDLQSQRGIDIKQIQQFSKNQGIKYFQISALNGFNLNQTFQELCLQLLKLKPPNQVTKDKNQNSHSYDKKQQNNENKIVQNKNINNKSLGQKNNRTQIKQNNCC